MAKPLKPNNNERMDLDFLKDMKDLAKCRYIKNLEKKLPSFREMTMLLRRTSVYPQVKEELKTKPRKENMFP